MGRRCLLYYITNRSQLSGDGPARRRALLAKVAEAAHAGVDYIQLREKDLGGRELEMLARDALSAVRNSVSLRTENRERRTRLLINSRADVALAAGADGVHLRSEDISPEEVRHVWALCGARPPAREKPSIAVSCHGLDDVDRAQKSGVDFAVFAPVFGKSNAPGAPPAGLAALQKACRAQIPVLALGGVTLENAASCLLAGAAGVAGIRLFQENNIEDVVRALRAL
jgi:thiamine-phosphate pyrophosphorylase